jgi:hypothetical protein
MCNNITIENGGSIKLQYGSIFSVFGSINTASGGVFNAKEGTIEMAGLSAQNISVNAFKGDSVMNLKLRNSSKSVTLLGPLNLLGKISFEGSNIRFVTNDFLTLKSSDTLTATVGDATNNNTQTGNSITGNVTVERYISNRKAWRLISMPTKHNLQTIHTSLQEGANANGNPTPGYGIQITSDRLSWLADGFDTLTSGGASMKMLNPMTNVYEGITTTNSRMTMGSGYMTFIRGNRSATSAASPSSKTIIREKGALQNDTVSFNNLSTAANQNIALGNPYASAIDFRKILLTNVQRLYYLWDPMLGTYGGYQTCVLSSGNNITMTPGGGSYVSGNYHIQSGQGFLVGSTASHAGVKYYEFCKVDSGNQVMRMSSNGVYLKTNLLSVQNHQAWLHDGVMIMLDSSYSNQIDEEDARKIIGSGEYIAINQNNEQLSVEKKKGISDVDTIHYEIGKMKVADYRLQFIAGDMDPSDMEAYLIDNYLHLRNYVSLTDTTNIDFSVNADPASYGSNRFVLVFKRVSVLANNNIEVNAVLEEQKVLVKWKIGNETGVDKFEVYRSEDGMHFTGITTQKAIGNLSYTYLDQNPSNGLNYYRVDYYDQKGTVVSSSIVKVQVWGNAEYSVYPNPVVKENNVYLMLKNRMLGSYQINIVQSSGRVLKTVSIQHTKQTASYILKLNNNWAAGIFHLEIIDPNRNKQVISFLYNK